MRQPLHLFVILMLAAGCGRFGYDTTGAGGSALGEGDGGLIDGWTEPDAGLRAAEANRCGDGTLGEEERCDDGNIADGDGCASDCQTEACGNGRLDVGESCDDGNADDSDGCDNDCDFSCETAAECDDGNPCNGAETCGSSHMCVSGAAPDADTVCSGGSCQAELCVPATCGDRSVQADEQCDDGNETPGDGCEADCTFTCTSDIECGLDRNSCNGTESCDLATHTCSVSARPAEGDVCDRNGDGVFEEACMRGVCVTPVCGDGVAHRVGAEECDDGNTVNGDGCDNDCTFSCDVDRECDDGNTCTARRVCNRSTHMCEPADTIAVDEELTCEAGYCDGGACVTDGGCGMTCGATERCCSSCAGGRGWCVSGREICPIPVCREEPVPR